MRIHVSTIPVQGMDFEFIEKPEHYPILSEMAKNGALAFVRPILNRVEVRHITGSVEVKGTLETVVRLSCGRCLGDFETPIRRRYRLYFTPTSPEDPEIPDEDGIELDAETINRVPYEGDAIELAESIQEQVVLSLPPYPLCDEACEGLCPRCGANLNTTGCDCRREEKSNPFAALKKLKLPEQ